MDGASIHAISVASLIIPRLAGSEAISEALSGAQFFNGVGGNFNPADVVAIVHNTNVNASSQTADGVDASARYRMSWHGGRALTLSGSATYLHSIQKLSDLQATVPLAGIIFNPPHFRARGGLVWTQPHITLSSFANYTGGVSDTRTSTAVRVNSMTTWDLAAHYDVPESRGLLRGVSVTLSVSNLLNAKPDVIAGQVYETPYDSTNYSPFGRVLSFTVSKHW